jgi:hypothetical protein
MPNIKVRDLVKEWIASTPTRPPASAADDKSSATAGGAFLGDPFTADVDATGVEIYSKLENLPTAIASILNKCQVNASFHPADTTPEQLAAAFSGYVEQIDKCPFLGLLATDNDHQSFYSSDYNLLIDQVVNLYRGLANEDLNVIKDQITDMAKSVFGQTKSEQWKNLFSQATIDMTDLKNPKLYLYYTSLHMMHDKSGKSEVSEQDYEVRQTSYVVLPDLIRTHAGALAALDKKSVNDWLDGTTSPERQNARLCFRSRPYGG